jgi:hypothetical protein
MVYFCTLSLNRHVKILDFKAEHTGGLIFTLHYVVSGHVINDGGSNSNVVQLALVITNNQTGGVLYQTTFSPLPAILTPNEEATFSTPFSTDDLGGYTGPINYAARVISQ